MSQVCNNNNSGYLQTHTIILATEQCLLPIKLSNPSVLKGALRRRCPLKTRRDRVRHEVGRAPHQSEVQFIRTSKILL